jgi:hypothetical protein
MTTRADRRVFPRRPFDAAVFTYESGARFVAHPVDLSLGGAFLATEAVERIAEGDLVSVVFGPETGTDPAVYLFARVARRQRGASKGVGVQWLKAVTTGKAPHLAAFLERLFGLRASSTEPQVASGEGRFRAQFSFEPIQDAARRHREIMDHLLGTPIAAPPVQRVAATPVTARPGTLEIRPPEAARDARGVITAELTTGGERAPVDLAASMVVDGIAYDVRVVEIGLASLEVVTVDPVPETPRPIDVSLDIPYQDRQVTVAMRGPITRHRRITGSRGVSLDVALRHLDEDGVPGLWARYAKWCFFQSLKA